MVVRTVLSAWCGAVLRQASGQVALSLSPRADLAPFAARYFGGGVSCSTTRACAGVRS